MPSWNSWYNPLDNAANWLRSSDAGNGVLGMVGGGFSYNSNGQPSAGQVIPGTFTQTAGGNRSTARGAQNSPTNTANVPNPTSPAVTYDSGAAAARAQYDAAIGDTQSAIGRLDARRNAGFGDIDSTYNSAVNQLTQDKARYEKQYGDNVNTTKQNYVTTKNQITSNIGNSLNSLLRLLGSRGAGGSSAALISAPQAAAREGTLQRQGAGENYGQNMQQLDTSWNNYLTDFNQSREDLDRQRLNNRSQFDGQIEQTRASLLQNLAQLMGQRDGGDSATAQRYRSDANSILDRIAGIGSQQVALRAPVTYDAPELSQYTANPFAAPQLSGGDGAATDFANPFLSLLLGRRQDERQV